MKDQNIVFALESERLDEHHDPRPTGRARSVGAAVRRRATRTQAACLVTGEHGADRAAASGDQGRVGRADRRAPRSSPSISTPSRPTATNRATTRPSRKPLPSPTRRRSTAFSNATAAIAFRSATPRRCSGPTPPTREAADGGGRLFRGLLGVDDRTRSVEAKKVERHSREAPRRPADRGFQARSAARRALLRSRPRAECGAALGALLSRGRFRRHRRALPRDISNACASSRRRERTRRRCGEC